MPSYTLRLYSRLEGQTPVLEAEATATSWHGYVHVRAPGFDGAVSVDLGECWRRALAMDGGRFEGEATGLETNVKFGRTVQLRERFRVVIDVDGAAYARKTQ